MSKNHPRLSGSVRQRKVELLDGELAIIDVPYIRGRYRCSEQGIARSWQFQRLIGLQTAAGQGFCFFMEALLFLLLN